MRCSPLVRISRSGIGHARRQQLALEAVPRRCASAASSPAATCARQAARRLQDLVARAVVDADVDVDAAVAARHVLGVGDVAHDVGRQPVAIADDAQPGAVLVQLRRARCAGSGAAGPSGRSTSSAGRVQFSVEKANSVSTGMPSSPAPRTTRRTASAPRRWPATRGRPRAFAQRPLPSMMMATWWGPGVGSAVGGQRRSRHQTVLISFSLWASTSSTCLT